jgi:CAI-1 autoinducer synthase
MNNAILSSTKRDAAERCLPDFVDRRMDLHYITRIEQLLGGEHPHAWQPTPADAVYLAGNDYLCLAGEPALVLRPWPPGADTGRVADVGRVSAAGQRPAPAGAASGAVLGSEDCILAQSGWAANVGLVQTLAGPGIPSTSTCRRTPSLWEGVQSAGATPVPFLHNDLGHLQKQLARHGRGLIVVDALYSTNGSVAPLVELVELAERSGCMLIVDESHSLGTHGPQGAGLVAALGLSERVHFRTASLAKALAGRAG